MTPYQKIKQLATKQSGSLKAWCAEHDLRYTTVQEIRKWPDTSPLLDRAWYIAHRLGVSCYWLFDEAEAMRRDGLNPDAPAPTVQQAEVSAERMDRLERTVDSLRRQLRESRARSRPKRKGA